jgi:hypothetical protein
MAGVDRASRTSSSVCAHLVLRALLLALIVVCLGSLTLQLRISITLSPNNNAGAIPVSLSFFRDEAKRGDDMSSSKVLKQAESVDTSSLAQNIEKDNDKDNENDSNSDKRGSSDRSSSVSCNVAVIVHIQGCLIEQPFCVKCSLRDYLSPPPLSTPC